MAGNPGSWSGRWGTDVPGTHWREGDAGHNVFLEGPMGETPGSPTVSMKLQSIAEQAKRYPAMVFNNVFHLIDREFLLEAYHQTRKSSAPGMDQVTAQQYAEQPGREPAGPARAAARQSVCGAASRAGMDREGRWEEEADRETLLRGQDRPAGGGDDPGSDLRAGFSCVFPWLQEGAQSTPSAARAA